MNHPNIEDGSFELYVLGLLEAEQAQQLEEHLREKCPECTEKLMRAQRVTAAMAGMARQVRPPANLRARVIKTVAPPRSASRWIYTVAALAATCAGLIVFSIWSMQENKHLLNQFVDMRLQRNELRSALQLMSEPETRTVQFGNIPNAPRGRVFVSRSGGVVFAGNALPTVASGKAFELWVVPAHGAPIPAGVFQANASGSGVAITPANVTASGAKAVAVSIEPATGSTAPTTKPFLIVPLA